MTKTLNFRAPHKYIISHFLYQVNDFFKISKNSFFLRKISLFSHFLLDIFYLILYNVVENK